VRRPNAALDFHRLREQRDTMFLLETIKTPMLTLRRQWLPATPEHLLFIGTPWITGTAQLSELGMTYGDFPIWAPMMDYLLLLQTSNASLADAQLLAARLRRQKNELEAANKALGALNAQLQLQVNERIEAERALHEAQQQLHKINEELEERVHQSIN